MGLWGSRAKFKESLSDGSQKTNNTWVPTPPAVVQWSLQTIFTAVYKGWYYHPNCQIRKLRLKDVTWSKSVHLVSGWTPAPSCPPCWEGKWSVNVRVFPSFGVQRVPYVSVQFFRGLRLPFPVSCVTLGKSLSGRLSPLPRISHLWVWEAHCMFGLEQTWSDFLNFYFLKIYLSHYSL